MATVSELSDLYSIVLINPLGPDSERVCSRCLTFISEGYEQCIPCGRHGVQGQQHADIVVPISYAVEGEQQLYRLLTGYKRALSPEAQRTFQLALGAILWRWTLNHEHCVARAAQVKGFDLVATVPSGERARDQAHPLRQIVGHLVAPLRPRYRRVLLRSAKDVAKREVDPEKYEVRGPVAGRNVLLIEDAWVSGSNAESAAGALKAAGATTVAVVAVGRVIDSTFKDNAARLEELDSIFDWNWCPYHALF